jgi:uncharacterized membrane protein
MFRQFDEEMTFTTFIVIGLLTRFTTNWLDILKGLRSNIIDIQLKISMFSGEQKDWVRWIFIAKSQIERVQRNSYWERHCPAHGYSRL